MESACPASCKEVSLWSGDAATLLIDVIKHLIRKAGFFREVVEVTSDLKGSTAALYQGKWSRFLIWCRGQNLSPRKVTITQIAKLFLYLWRELKFSVPAVKGYFVALIYVFSLAGLYLPSNHVISRMLCIFKKTCPQRR